MNEFGTKMACSSGYVSKIDQDLCANCGTCVDACPFEAISANGVTKINYEKCMGCGVCVDLCPSEAISFLRDEQKGMPLDVRLLESNSMK
jgi:ferredoxin